MNPSRNLIGTPILCEENKYRDALPTAKLKDIIKTPTSDPQVPGASGRYPTPARRQCQRKIIRQRLFSQ